MSFGPNIMPSLVMLGMNMNSSHISMSYHLVIVPSRQELRHENIFLKIC
jgi:hypothetical protein